MFHIYNSSKKNCLIGKFDFLQQQKKSVSLSAPKIQNSVVKSDDNEPALAHHTGTINI